MRNKGLSYRERRHGHDNDDENEEKHERGGRHLQVHHEGHENECEGERGRSYERCGLKRDDDCKMGSPSTRTMSSLGKATLLVALLFASESIVSAEQRSDTGTLEDGPRLLTRAEGEAQPRTVLERASIGTLLRRNNTLTGEQESDQQC